MQSLFLQPKSCLVAHTPHEGLVGQKESTDRKIHLVVILSNLLILIGFVLAGSCLYLLPKGFTLAYGLALLARS